MGEVGAGEDDDREEREEDAEDAAAAHLLFVWCVGRAFFNVYTSVVSQSTTPPVHPSDRPTTHVGGPLELHVAHGVAGAVEPAEARGEHRVDLRVDDDVLDALVREDVACMCG